MNALGKSFAQVESLFNLTFAVFFRNVSKSFS